MRKATRISLALGTSAALLSLSALPASAAENDPNDTRATIPVQPGSLSITVPAGGTTLTAALNEFDENLDRTASIKVDGVSVTDYRAGAEGWELSVSLSDFRGSDDHFIESSGAKYELGALITAGTITALPEKAVVLAGAEDVAVGTISPNVTGNNKASWNATVTVDVPSEALTQDYTATLTHSVS